jgi:hypothetical protein
MQLYYANKSKKPLIINRLASPGVGVKPVASKSLIIKAFYVISSYYPSIAWDAIVIFIGNKKADANCIGPHTIPELC